MVRGLLTCLSGNEESDGRADVVANDAGDRVTPAVVAYSENEEVVGLAAKQSRIRNISNTVMKVKQILGRRLVKDEHPSDKLLHVGPASCLMLQVFPTLSVYLEDNDLDLAVQELSSASLPSQSTMASSNSSAGIRWSRQETRTLLSILGEAEYIQRLHTVHHNADVYQAVSKRMQQEGFRRTDRQCRSKFKVLKALYLKAYVAHATSMGDPPHCPFYETLDQLLRNQVVADPDNLMEDAAWAKHYTQNLMASGNPGEEGADILKPKRTQAADYQPISKTVKESDEDCQLRITDQMQETSDIEDSWDESSGAGCSQGTPSYSSSHHLFRGAVAPCQSSPMTRLGVSAQSLHQHGRNTPGVAFTQQPPISSGVPFSGGDRPLTTEPPPRWARRRRRSVARTIAAELAENRRLARELSKREEEKLDRLIAIGEEASAQQDTANELRRDAVIAVRPWQQQWKRQPVLFSSGLKNCFRGAEVLNHAPSYYQAVGSDDPQAQKYITESKCLVIEKNGKLRYKIDTGEETKFVNPGDVARLIFSKMKETAHSVLGSDANDVVITVPFDFGEKQKNALGEAARAAGFNVLRLIHEPSAALLAYGIGQDSPAGKSNILVFKLGGTSLSITVMEVNSGIYRVISTNTDDNIGGTQFTETLAQHLASEFQRSFKHDVRGNARAMMKLMNSADIAKHSLSTLGSANCFLDSLYEGQDFDCNVSSSYSVIITLLGAQGMKSSTLKGTVGLEAAVGIGVGLGPSSAPHSAPPAVASAGGGVVPCLLAAPLPPPPQMTAWSNWGQRQQRVQAVAAAPIAPQEVEEP
ncbi:LOW QUALITY PROTEIN: hypothetical protein QTO34_008065 [Cnephaeus nilssonii]|uniref:Myb/SANT-like DNA-binding domain-containing protein n=1 Tax=Cnephaeus nilssonii TaxID=3371016 RepID=A0AA40I9P5_CNENI|nr:LOW QUALITY PROTEIN: hypothetical protein QTO34_008065 [Eptesicus nilssonii]